VWKDTGVGYVEPGDGVPYGLRLRFAEGVGTAVVTSVAPGGAIDPVGGVVAVEVHAAVGQGRVLVGAGFRLWTGAIEVGAEVGSSTPLAVLQVEDVGVRVDHREEDDPYGGEGVREGPRRVQEGEEAHWLVAVRER